MSRTTHYETLSDLLAGESIPNIDAPWAPHLPSAWVENPTFGWAGLTCRVLANAHGSALHRLADAIARGVVTTRPTKTTEALTYPGAPPYTLVYVLRGTDSEPTGTPVRHRHRTVTLTICEDCWTAVTPAGTCLCA